MGNYITTADIVDDGGLSAAQLNNIINFRFLFRDNKHDGKC